MYAHAQRAADCFFLQSHSTTEKISDGVRKGFKKLTGLSHRSSRPRLGLIFLQAKMSPFKTRPTLNNISTVVVSVVKGIQKHLVKIRSLSR